MDEFNLNTPSGEFRFFFELHNLPSALPRDDELSEAKTHLDALKEEVDRKGLGGFTTQPSKPSKRPKTNSNAPPNNDNIFDNTSTAQQVSSAGYQLLPDEPVEGWTPLNPVRSLFDIGLYRAIKQYNDSSRQLSAVQEDRRAKLFSSSWSTRTSSQYIHSSAALRHHRTTRSLSLMSSHLA